MKGFLLTLALAAALALTSCEPPPADPSRGVHEFTKADTEAIMAVLDRQVAAWNKGDLDGFMEAYTREGGLRFTSERGVLRGWEEARERYRRDYPEASTMGQLSFEELEVTPLSADYAEVFGRYLLKWPGDTPAASGRYTFLFKRTAAGWRILHDHSTTSGGE